MVITESVFSPAARPRWCDVAREVVPRRWAKNVLDLTACPGRATPYGRCIAYGRLGQWSLLRREHEMNDLVHGRERGGKLAHGTEFGIGRPYLDKDPPHLGPIDGKEYAAHRGRIHALLARLDTIRHHRSGR